MVNCQIGRSVLLMGIPRSGTSLVCRLLNQLPDTVALLEPMVMSAFQRDMDPDEVCSVIASFVESSRRSILTRGKAITRHRDGVIPENMFNSESNASGLREQITTRGEIIVAKQLTDSFTLVVKHPAAFTALLSTLSGRYPCVAVIRNPAAVLASWNTVDASFRHGYSPAAERFDPALESELRAICDDHCRQLHLLSWYYSQYRFFLPSESILRYEDIIDSGGAALVAITPRANGLSESLSSRDASPIYRRALSPMIEGLIQSEGAYWTFYSRESVMRLAVALGLGKSVRG